MPTEHTINLDYGLGSDIDMLRDTVRSFASEKIALRAAEIDEKDSFPIDLWPAMGELGLHGITVREEFGGAIWAIWPIASRWRKSPRPPLLSGSAMARIPTSASTRSTAGVPMSRGTAICPS